MSYYELLYLKHFILPIEVAESLLERLSTGKSENTEGKDPTMREDKIHTAFFRICNQFNPFAIFEKNIFFYFSSSSKLKQHPELFKGAFVFSSLLL